MASAARSSHPRLESPAVQAAARELGLRPATIGGYVRKEGIHLTVAAIIRQALEAGETGLAARLYWPIHHAYYAAEVLPLTEDLIARVQAADLLEDLRENEYRANSSLANLRAWVAAQREQQQRAAELLVASEHALRQVPTGPGLRKAS